MLTRAAFIPSVDDVWEIAMRSFDRDKVLDSHVAALNLRGELLYFTPCPDPDTATGLAAQGFVPVPGPWRDHLGLIKAEFIRHKAVAAIFVGEARAVQDPCADETLRRDINHSEQPMPGEVAFCFGFWPRERVAIGNIATIERDSQGECPRLVHQRRETGVETGLAAWLPDLLPQPSH